MSALKRGYCDSLRVDWDRPGVGGFSTITLMRGKRPAAVVLGDYIPGQLDPDMETLADRFAASGALLEAVLLALPYVEAAEDDASYKPGAVRKVSAQMRAALQAAGVA